MVQSQYKNDYDGHVQLEHHFAVDDDVFTKHPLQIPSAADQFVYKEYFNLTPRLVEPSSLLNVGSKYTKFDHNDIVNTGSINRLTGEYLGTNSLK